MIRVGRVRSRLRTQATASGGERWERRVAGDQECQGADDAHARDGLCQVKLTSRRRSERRDAPHRPEHEQHRCGCDHERVERQGAVDVALYECVDGARGSAQRTPPAGQPVERAWRGEPGAVGIDGGECHRAHQRGPSDGQRCRCESCLLSHVMESRASVDAIARERGRVDEMRATVR